MSRSVVDQQPLFVWSLWEELPEPIRQQAIEVLATVYLETIEHPRMEQPAEEARDH